MKFGRESQFGNSDVSDNLISVFPEMTGHVMMTQSKFYNVFSLYLEDWKCPSKTLAATWELQNKARNELR